MLPLLAVGILISCGSPEDPAGGCRAPCGITARGMGDCPDYQATLDECLDSYARHVSGWSREATCPKLDGWHVTVRRTDGGSFTGADGKTPVAGQTWLDRASIELSDLPWHRGALCHEIGHVLENAINHRVDYAHAGWRNAGIFDGIDEARALGIQRAEADGGI